jgi:hypothetical protein
MAFRARAVPQPPVTTGYGPGISLPVITKKNPKEVETYPTWWGLLDRRQATPYSPGVGDDADLSPEHTMTEIFKQHENGRHGHIRQYEGQWLLQVYASESRKRGEAFVTQAFFGTLQEARYALRRALAR